jgi:peptide/nickel transport system substrate-binding protein
VCATAAALGLLSACTTGSTKAAPTTTSSTTAAPTITQGGDITVAAEGDPGCMDWISTCAGSSWGIWTVETNTMPRAYDYTRDNLYKPSILLTGEAQVQTAPEQVVTYHLNPRAIWSDGQPITAHDFKYTWDQIAHGLNIADSSGYKDIVTVDDSDPVTAVVTFSQTYADWRKLFGGPFGILPSHLLEGHDRNALMKDGYTWSGGPWALAPGGWVRGQSIRLVPNPDYWGKKPDLGSVTFQIFPDAASELQAYAAGQVVAAYPAAEPAIAGYRSLPNTSDNATGGLDLVALWFDVAKAPVDAKAVRQAVAYSLDRAAIVTQTLGAFSPGATPIQDLLTPAYGPYYGEPFAKYRQDTAAGAQLMAAAGWTRGADGIWAKATQKAAIELKVSAASTRDQQIAQLVQTQLHAAGFAVTVTAEAPATLLAKDVPAGTFTAAIYPLDTRRVVSGTVPPGAGTFDNDPGQCRLFCSTAIPGGAPLVGTTTVPSTTTVPTTTLPGLAGTAAAGGANYDRIVDPTLDRYLADLDANLSDDGRLTDAQQAASLLADLVPAIPLAALPDTVVVNTAKVSVEGGTFNHNLAYGPYSYLNEWFLKTGS